MQDDHGMTRRTMVAASAAAALGMVAAGASAALGSQAQPTVDGSQRMVDGVQYGFAVDVDRCVGCRKCVAACRKYNHLEEGAPDRRTVKTYRDKHGKNVYLSTSCMHCAEPTCLDVCPAGAISKGPAGIVSVDETRCIGCKYCYFACPYGVPKYDSEAMDKCDCCLDAGVEPGETPHCVKACKFGALTFGPVGQLAKEHPGAIPVAKANGPSCLVVRGRG